MIEAETNAIVLFDESTAIEDLLIITISPLYL